MLNAAQMTRSRLYVLLDAFETDLRQLIRSHLSERHDEPELLGPSYEKARAKRSADGREDELDLVEYLDLREAYDVLNRFRSVLPAHIADEVRRNTADMDRLVPIRNRVMHGRPLQVGDPEAAVAICYGFTLSDWPTVRETLDHLVSDPIWEPVFDDQGRRSDRILNNLPLPDYDETGLIGRSSVSRQVVQLLKRRRQSVVTIIGEGGIGKSALALEAAYFLLDDVESPFDCILWASMKVERLTAEGVADVADAIMDVTGATRQYGRALDSGFGGGVATLSEMLEGIEALIILDNLETVDGREVVEFVDALPDSVTFLFTSRVGIGQMERRVELGPLEDRDADRLFRSFAKSRGIDRLSTLSADTLREVCFRLRNSPLAIRWYILSVEAGHQPNLALANQDVLLNFCVRSVHRGMTESARVLLGVIFALDRDVTFDELVVFASLELDSVRGGVHELLRGSLVVLEPDREDALITRVRLTQACRQFLGQVEPPRSQTMEDVLAKEREFREAEERRRLDEKERQFSPNVVRTRSSNDAPTAHFLRLALTASKNGDADRAYSYIQKARGLNPDYWEVDRVEGFIYSSFDLIEPATGAYRSALRRAPDEYAVAVISYYFSGHLARKERNLPSAIECARTAHQHFLDPETAKNLGTMLVWNRQFREGQELLESALDDSEGRLHLIALTALADSWRRWAEWLIENDRRPQEAADKAYTGFIIAAKEIDKGVFDLKLANTVVECASACMRAIQSPAVDPSEHLYKLEQIVARLVSRRGMYARTRAWNYILGWFHKAAVLPGLPDRLRDECLGLGEREATGHDVPSQEEGHELVGEICAWLDTYGFIAHADIPENVFFPASAVEGLTRERARLDLSGMQVRFVVSKDDQGRVRAERVRFTEERVEGS